MGEKVGGRTAWVRRSEEASFLLRWTPALTLTKIATSCIWVSKPDRSSVACYRQDTNAVRVIPRPLTPESMDPTTVTLAAVDAYSKFEESTYFFTYKTEARGNYTGEET